MPRPPAPAGASTCVTVQSVFGGGNDDLGSLLRGYRMRSGLTQAGLAGRAGLSERGLRDLERGRSRRPHLTSIHRLDEDGT